jgi:protein TonB
MRETSTPVISDNDRFGLTLFLATIFHGMIILGVTFTISPVADSKTPPALDVILVQTKSPVETDDADYLAQVSQQGGGIKNEKTKPTELFSAPTLASEPGVTVQAEEPRIKKQQQVEKLALLKNKNSDHTVQSQDNSAKIEQNVDIHQTNQNQNAKTARQAAEIDNTIELQTSIDRIKYLNSSTKEFTPAQYMREWINRVERIGNLNYPDQARRNHLTGTLILDVVINADGELIRTELRQSSGHQILDDAAKRIVKLAAPFSAFPKKLRQEADVIHITRSWEFMSNSNLRTH